MSKSHSKVKTIVGGCSVSFRIEFDRALPREEVTQHLIQQCMNVLLGKYVVQMHTVDGTESLVATVTTEPQKLEAAVEGDAFA